MKSYISRESNLARRRVLTDLENQYCFYPVHMVVEKRKAYVPEKVEKPFVLPSKLKFGEQNCFFIRVLDDSFEKFDVEKGDYMMLKKVPKQIRPGDSIIMRDDEGRLYVADYYMKRRPADGKLAGQVVPRKGEVGCPVTNDHIFGVFIMSLRSYMNVECPPLLTTLNSVE